MLLLKRSEAEPHTIHMHSKVAISQHWNPQVPMLLTVGRNGPVVNITSTNFARTMNKSRTSVE
jgi:hypothetical protein